MFNHEWTRLNTEKYYIRVFAGQETSYSYFQKKTVRQV
jgi:hypothetical protein